LIPIVDEMAMRDVNKKMKQVRPNIHLLCLGATGPRGRRFESGAGESGQEVELPGDDVQE
jgi:hypothetical protein